MTKPKPLTKDKINKECDETCSEDTKIVHLDDLTSALELYSEKISHLLDADSCLILARSELKKAFPAIYESED